MIYQDIRKKMRPGDLIAFGGSGVISGIIKNATHCNVSHVGVILQSNLPTVEGSMINQIIESTSIGNGFSGVKINRMSDHIRDYKGEMWWIPISDAARGVFDEGSFLLWMLQQVGKPYDAPQAIMSALDFISDTKEDLSKLFCSELLAAGYEKCGVIGMINASEQTPYDICKLKIFAPGIQIKGIKKEIFR